MWDTEEPSQNPSSKQRVHKLLQELELCELKDNLAEIRDTGPSSKQRLPQRLQELKLRELKVNTLGERGLIRQSKRLEEVNNLTTETLQIMKEE